MAPSIKCLPRKHKELCLDPQHPCSKLGVMALLCNPSAGDRKATGVLLSVSPNQSAPGFMSDPVSENKVKSSGDESRC